MLCQKSSIAAVVVWLGAEAIVFAAGAVTANNAEVFGNRPVVRVAPERAVGGISTAEYFDRQRELHARLMAEMPDGTLNALIRVEL